MKAIITTPIGNTRIEDITHYRIIPGEQTRHGIQLIVLYLKDRSSYTVPTQYVRVEGIS